MKPGDMDQTTRVGERTPMPELLSPGAWLPLGGCSWLESYHLENWGGG